MKLQGEPLLIISADAANCVAMWDRVLISMWQGEMTHETCEQLSKAASQFSSENGRGPLSCLTIIGSDCPPPREKVRVQLTTVYQELTTASIHHYWVAEGSPARAALFLGVGLALSSAAAAPLDLKFALSVDEASQLIAPMLSSASGRAPVLRSIVEQVRAHVRQHHLGRRESGAPG